MATITIEGNKKELGVLVAVLVSQTIPILESFRKLPNQDCYRLVLSCDGSGASQYPDNPSEYLDMWVKQEKIDNAIADESARLSTNRHMAYILNGGKEPNDMPSLDQADSYTQYPQVDYPD